MPSTVFVFGDAELDVGRYELRQRSRRVKLEKIPMELLILLLTRKGELVAREEIVEKLWRGEVFVEAEQGINTAIRKIRRALGDDPERPRFVQTVVGKGYRLIAPITVLDGAAPPAVATSPSVTPEKAVAPPALEGAHGRRRRLIWLAGAGAGMLILLAAGVERASRRARSSADSGPGGVRSVAVLPLENLSGDPAQDYFADGMTEALVTDLAKISALRVISRTSVMQYKGVRKSLPAIARELNVDFVVEGAVMRSGERVRITAQLIDAKTDQHVWAEDYERSLRDVIGLQSEVAAAVAREVRVKLTPQEQAGLAAQRPVEPTVYEAYLKGRYYWNQRTEAGLQRGIEHFRDAIARDPNFALAHSGLADSLTALGYLSAVAPQDAFPAARAAATRALELDASLAEPHASLAYVRLYYDWDWKGAETEFRTAIAANPNYATAHHWYSVYLTAMGRADEALAEIERARALDPLSLAVSTDVGFEAYYSGRYDRAVRQLQAVLVTSPGFPLAHLWLGRTYQQKQMYREALAEYEHANRVLPRWPVILAAIGNVHGLMGDRSRARTVLDEMKSLSRERYVTPYGVALVYAGLGEVEQAFKWLNTACDERAHWLVWLKLDPRWDGLRSDRRFGEVLRRVGLTH
jgi:TolB-like protein/DNA-binding winged helix-turn-helix (wHTH) protein/lipoprotein NlpI